MLGHVGEVIVTFHKRTMSVDGIHSKDAGTFVVRFYGIDKSSYRITRLFGLVV